MQHASPRLPSVYPVRRGGRKREGLHSRGSGWASQVSHFISGSTTCSPVQQQRQCCLPGARTGAERPAMCFPWFQIEPHPCSTAGAALSLGLKSGPRFPPAGREGAARQHRGRAAGPRWMSTWVLHQHGQGEAASHREPTKPVNHPMCGYFLPPTTRPTPAPGGGVGRFLELLSTAHPFWR